MKVLELLGEQIDRVKLKYGVGEVVVAGMRRGVGAGGVF